MAPDLLAVQAELVEMIGTIKENIQQIKRFALAATAARYAVRESQVIWEFMNNMKNYFILMRTNMLFVYPFNGNNEISSQYKPYFIQYDQGSTLKLHVYEEYRQFFFKESLKAIQNTFIKQAQLFLYLEKR